MLYLNDSSEIEDRELVVGAQSQRRVKERSKQNDTHNILRQSFVAPHFCACRLTILDLHLTTSLEFNR